MTREEAKKILEAYIACESKKAHFKCSEYNCDDDCPLLYDMGTVGEYNEAINMAIQVLEQQSSGSEKPNNCDLISREDALMALTGEWTEITDEIIHRFIRRIKALPSVKPQEKTGHWEWVQYDYNPKIGNWHCTECRCIVVECVDKNEKGGIPLYKYCPQCGAKMEVEKNG